MREATNLPVDMSEVLAQSQLHKEESSLSLNGFVKAVDTGFTATAKTDSPGRTTHSRRHTTSSVTSPTTPGLSRMRDSTVPTDLVSLNDSDDDGDMAAVHLNRLAESLNVTARPVMKSTAQLLAEPVTPPPMPGKSSGPSRRNSFQSNTLMFPLPGAPRSRSFNGGVQVLTDASIISMAPASPTASGNQDSLLQASTVITMDDQQLLCDPFQEVARFLDHVLHGAGLPSSIEETVTSLLDQGNFHDAHSTFVQTVASLGRLHVVSYKPVAEDSHQFHNICEHILHLIKRLSESAINLALCRLTISQAVTANNLNEGINQSSVQAPVTETSAEAATSEKEKANEDEFVALRPWKNLGQVPILSPDEIVRSVSLSKAPRRLSSAYSHMGDQAQDFDGAANFVLHKSIMPPVQERPDTDDSASETGAPRPATASMPASTLPGVVLLNKLNTAVPITWALFDFVFLRARNEEEHRLNQSDCSVLLSMATRLIEHHDLDRSLTVLATIPEQFRDVVVCKFMVYLYLSKRPKDITSAEKVLAEFENFNVRQRRAKIASRRETIMITIQPDGDTNHGGVPAKALQAALIAASQEQVQQSTPEGLGDASEDIPPISSSEESLSAVQSSVLWLFFTTLVRDAKWTECLNRYEQARANGGTATIMPGLATPQRIQSRTSSAASNTQLFLDNAMLEVCMIYGEYDYGWIVYERMKNLYDRHTIIVIITLIWRAFFIASRKGKVASSGDNPADSEESRMLPDGLGGDDMDDELPVEDQLRHWEARAWAVYGRMQSSDKFTQKHCQSYVELRLKDIVRISPEVESRSAKLLRIAGKKR